MVIQIIIASIAVVLPISLIIFMAIAICCKEKYIQQLLDQIADKNKYIEKLEQQIGLDALALNEEVQLLRGKVHDLRQLRQLDSEAIQSLNNKITELHGKLNAYKHLQNIADELKNIEK